jgi:hypothetical protein
VEETTLQDAPQASMPEPPPLIPAGAHEDGTLAATALAHAEAFARGDGAAFASYMTPQAVVALRGATRVRPLFGQPRAELVRAAVNSGGGESQARIRGGGEQTLSCSWEMRDGKWVAVTATLDPARPRLPWWRRPFGAPRAVDMPERRDLA